MRHLRNIAIACATLVMMFVLGLGADVSAQEVISRRPAADILNWGRDRLPYPKWLANVEERSDKVAQGVWQRGGAIVLFREDFKFPNYSLSQIRQYTDSNLDTVMSQYGKWQLIDQCVVADHVLIDISALRSDDPTITYQVRYWVWSDREAFKEVFMAFNTDSTNQLEGLSDLFFPKAARCPATK